MKELTPEQTSKLANAYVKSFGYRDAARKLAERGYRSRENKEIRHAHLSRILSGSTTQFLAPEPEPKEESLQTPEPTPARYLERAPVSANDSLDIKLSVEGPGNFAGSFEGKDIEPTPALPRRPTYQEKAPLPLPFVVNKEPVAVPFSDEEFEREERNRTLHTENRKQLRQELEDEEELRKLKEEELPGLVPAPSGRGEHPHVQQMAKVTGIFTRRGPAPELEEEKTFYGIPAMQRKSSVTTTRPHEVTHFGANVLSTRDLSTRQKKRS